ncbi:MAG: hypothetical protein AOA66_1409 [Candidatus Bathyarchaeota archaeon BA2]|nr:MAG: hypothetical protein AOA66_1409 [Candidatus Bathyarchaeota archaeon BA2]
MAKKSAIATNPFSAVHLNTRRFQRFSEAMAIHQSRFTVNVVIFVYILFTRIVGI